MKLRSSLRPATLKRRTAVRRRREVRGMRRKRKQVGAVLAGEKRTVGLSPQVLSVFRKYEKVSPFEIKDKLISLAKTTSRGSAHTMLNAGRGNPNWVATTPREGFFLLGQFAVTESKRVMEHPAGVGGMPQSSGIAARFAGWLEKHSDMPGASFLAEMTKFAVKKFGFEG